MLLVPRYAVVLRRCTLSSRLACAGLGVDGHLGKGLVMGGGPAWETVDAALAVLRTPGAPHRLAALEWLAATAPQTFSEADCALLTDPDLAVREAATYALRLARVPLVVHAARRALRTLLFGAAAERHAGLRVAARVANPTLAPRLFPFLRHADPLTRQLTLLALAAVPPGLLAPDLLPRQFMAALADPDPAVRTTAGAIVDTVAVGVEHVPASTA